MLAAVLEPFAGQAVMRPAAGPSFRFTDRNPLTGVSFARSAFEDLPYLVGVLVRRELLLSDMEWDCLLTSGSTLFVTGRGEFRVPFALAPTAERPPPCLSPGMCRDCRGSGYTQDTDLSMTGVANAWAACMCTCEELGFFL